MISKSKPAFRSVGPETKESVLNDATLDDNSYYDYDSWKAAGKDSSVSSSRKTNKESHEGSMSIDPTSLQREREALSFNPFGDDEPGLSSVDGEKQQNLEQLPLPLQLQEKQDHNDNATDKLTQGLAQLKIPSPASISIRASSNESSAASGSTNPLFDAIIDQDPTPQPPSKGDGYVQAGHHQQQAAAAVAAAAAIPHKAPYSPTAPSFVSSSSSPLLDGQYPSSSHHHQRSPSISISIGSGSAPRRHRLSSASSVKSTRSRRSTSSSLASSFSSQRYQNGGPGTGTIYSAHDPDAHLAESLEGDLTQKLAEMPIDVTAATSSTVTSPLTGDGGDTYNHNNNKTGETIIRPILQQSSSQDSSNSLQPSVMSLETTSQAPPPVAGYRVPATGSLRMSTFPQLSMCGPAFKDRNEQPIYVCSAILGTAIHPAKAGPHLSPPVRMTFAGKEILHEGRFDLLPITPE